MGCKKFIDYIKTLNHPRSDVSYDTVQHTNLTTLHYYPDITVDRHWLFSLFAKTGCTKSFVGNRVILEYEDKRIDAFELVEAPDNPEKFYIVVIKDVDGLYTKGQTLNIQDPIPEVSK